MSSFFYVEDINIPSVNFYRQNGNSLHTEKKEDKVICI